MISKGAIEKAEVENFNKKMEVLAKKYVVKSSDEENGVKIAANF